jgi:hypothetical protein
MTYHTRLSRASRRAQWTEEGDPGVVLWMCLIVAAAAVVALLWWAVA